MQRRNTSRRTSRQCLLDWSQKISQSYTSNDGSKTNQGVDWNVTSFNVNTRLTSILQLRQIIEKKEFIMWTKMCFLCRFDPFVAFAAPSPRMLFQIFKGKIIAKADRKFTMNGEFGSHWARPRSWTAMNENWVVRAKIFPRRCKIPRAKLPFLFSFFSHEVLEANWPYEHTNCLFLSTQSFNRI